ncbi:hypothetical protein BJV78DRAFT_918574 [Lactifluus subvellereus]|nr:hypothetical protein BJV78DRAFT_918574 [Lactifluus subvellereus]
MPFPKPNRIRTLVPTPVPTFQRSLRCSLWYRPRRPGPLYLCLILSIRQDGQSRRSSCRARGRTTCSAAPRTPTTPATTTPTEATASNFPRRLGKCTDERDSMADAPLNYYIVILLLWIGLVGCAPTSIYGPSYSNFSYCFGCCFFYSFFCIEKIYPLSLMIIIVRAAWQWRVSLATSLFGEEQGGQRSYDEKVTGQVVH